MGSSPRVRSRPNWLDEKLRRYGIISACAEQTQNKSRLSLSKTDHLRVCGADINEIWIRVFADGSSPRVRSRPGVRARRRRRTGIISACAEQTSRRGRASRLAWDHLRVCGADLPQVRHSAVSWGSSPRVRSRRVGGERCRPGGGIISACAEQT